jgi:hypothetical protein
MHDELPIIVFLDLDKTVIGRSHAQVEHMFLRKVIEELVEVGEVPARVQAALSKRANASPADEIGPLVRPGFADAVRRIEAALGRVEWFVCTMGMPLTVMELKVPGIERATKVRFNRPVFTQAECRAATDDGKKLMWQCFQKAVAALARKEKYAGVRHQLLDADTMRNVMFARRFFMVDDTPDVALDDASNRRLVTCPPYERARPSSAEPFPPPNSCASQRWRDTWLPAGYPTQAPKGRATLWTPSGATSRRLRSGARASTPSLHSELLS